MCYSGIFRKVKPPKSPASPGNRRGNRCATPADPLLSCRRRVERRHGGARMNGKADHGGGIDSAAARWGGARADWLDLSTGINPMPYPLPPLPPDAWTALPDAAAQSALEQAARTFWQVPEGAALVATNGASAAIALLPQLLPPARVRIDGPTYNEHARAFRAAGWALTEGPAEAMVVVHPNNPDGRLWRADEIAAPALAVIDESFGEVAPNSSLIALADRPRTVVLKSFGKFWGLAGLRLGFVIGDPAPIARLAARLGPWPVSGPALAIATAALADTGWTHATRRRLAEDATRLDALVTARGAHLVGGTALFRLYDTGDAQAWQEGLARHRILGRVFPYSARWLRLGLPGRTEHWQRLATALNEVGR